MTTDNRQAPGHASFNGHRGSGRSVLDEPSDYQYGPAAPETGVRRWLRARAGIDEKILDWTPWDRPRYTMLGTIIVNTAVLAGIAFIFTLVSLTHGNWLVLVPFAVFWGFLIMTLDQWLVASTQGVPKRSTLAIFAPRLALSILLGFTIAEPLVLFVFRTPVQNEIAEYRKAQVDSYESLLKDCNPMVGDRPTNRDCDSHQISIAHPPAAVERELTTATVQLTQLLDTVTNIDAQLDRYETIAQKECAGTASEETTGVPGNGPECKRDRAVADNYRSTTQIEQQHINLVELQNKVTGLNQKLANARSTSTSETTDGIAAKVEEKRANLKGTSILDEHDALSRLSSKHWSVFFLSWLLRFVLIALDCAPVLSKWIAGPTSYDRRLDRQTDSANQQHATQVSVGDHAHTIDHELESQLIEQRLRNRTEELIDRDRVGRARRKAEINAQIDEFAADLEQSYRRS